MTSWSTVTVSGYNASPPPDDGSLVVANKVTWATQKSKLADPLNTAIVALNASGVAMGVIVDSLAASPGSYRNIVINGDLDVWTRGAGGSASFALAASTAFNTYTAERVYTGTGPNQASVVSQVTGLTSGSRSGLKFLRNAGQTGTNQMSLSLPLTTDQLTPLRGQFVCASVVLKAGANFSPASNQIQMQLFVGTGAECKRSAGFTGDTQILFTTCNTTTTAARFQGTTAAVFPTTSTQAELVFTWSPVGTAGADDSFTIDDIQIEIVASAAGTASTFERHPFDVELQRCERYFRKTFPYATAPAQNAGVTGALTVFSGTGVTNTEGLTWWYGGRMRTTPAITTFNPSVANANWRDVTSGADRVVTVGTVSDTSVPISLAAGAAATTNQIHAQADADL